MERKKTTVCLVLDDDNKSWIIEKMAHRLAEHAAEFGFDAVFDTNPRSDVALNHWMSYAFANVAQPRPATMLITHIDDPFKLRLVRSELANGIHVGICMSSDAVADLSARGVPRDSLAYVLPAHDARATPRRIVLGLTTRLYPDGRKREHLLVELAQRMSLAPFRFDIFGAGWEAVVPKLQDAGAEVRFFPGTDDYGGDYAEMIAAIPGFDYYLYLGLDEGSLGTLDALAAGVKTIVTPQGFHLDLPEGLTHPVTDLDSLEAILRDAAARRAARVASVCGLTWREHTRKHCLIWRAVIDGRTAELPEILEQPDTPPRATPVNGGFRYWARALSPIRLRSALSHFPLLKPIRRMLRRRRG